MFNSPTRHGFSVTPRPMFNLMEDKMAAPNNAYYVLTEAHAGLPNSVLTTALTTSLIPDDTNTYDLGTDDLRWRNLWSSGSIIAFSFVTGAFTFMIDETGSLSDYFTSARADTWLATQTTDDLSEGAANLYYTDARVGTYGDAAYLKLDGSNANSDINIGAYDFAATDITASGELKGGRVQFDAANNTNNLGTGISFLKYNNGTVMTINDGYSMPRDGSIVSVSGNIRCLAFTAGPPRIVAFAVLINNVIVFSAVGITVNAAGRFHGEVTQARGTDTFSQGDLLTMKVDNAGAGTATLAYPCCVVDVQFND